MNVKGSIRKEKDKRVFLFLFFTLCFLVFVNDSTAQSTIPPIGYWREHLNYQNTTQVLKGDKIYCATVNNLFSIDPSFDIQRFSKVNGLNDMGVSCIGWDDQSQQLVVAYKNSNVDVIQGSIVRNIGDIKRSQINGNKTIYSLYCKAGYAYASTGLGIIVIDLDRYEIKDTWIIGNNGNQGKVNAFTSGSTNFWAATDEGLKAAPVTSSSLADYANWINISGANGLSSGKVNNVFIVNGVPVIQKNDSLFSFTNNNWQLLYTDTSWSILNCNTTGNKIWIAQRNAGGNSRVIILNNGTVEKILSQPGVISLPQFVCADNNSYWVADYYGGLSNFGNTVQQFIPNGPPGTADGDMLVANNTVYAAAGSVNDAWNYQYNRNGIYNFSNGMWNYENAFNKPVLDTVLDFITLAADPSDQSIWAGSYGGGLAHFHDQQIDIFKQKNSTLQPAIGDPSSYRVSGLAFDQHQNLWISNYGAPQDLQVRKKDGSWKSFSIPFTHAENAVSQVVVDDANQLWIVSPRGNGVFCYNYGAGIDALNDDQWAFLQSGIGYGNLPSNNVYCLAKDKYGFIWIGTDQGIAIVQCAPNFFTQKCDAVWPVVQQDQYAGYLFHDQQVQCIAVDGANRKWVGTNNGAWLVSPEGDQIITHFTESNSPLLNNDVKKITIDPQTGEVFFATFSGICSFRGTATDAGTVTNSVLVFPNPVPPGYHGTIAIRGVAENALVKIAELNGRLVYQARALGGQMVWDGTNYKGEKVASGVYLVLIRDNDGTEKLVTKIVIISGR